MLVKKLAQFVLTTASITIISSVSSVIIFFGDGPLRRCGEHHFCSKAGFSVSERHYLDFQFWEPRLLAIIIICALSIWFCRSLIDGKCDGPSRTDTDIQIGD